MITVKYLRRLFAFLFMLVLPLFSWAAPDSETAIFAGGCFWSMQHALRAGIIERDEVIELGKVLAGDSPRRSSEEQTTIVDLTGLAVQDIEIAKLVYERLESL